MCPYKKRKCEPRLRLRGERRRETQQSGVAMEDGSDEFTAGMPTIPEKPEEAEDSRKDAFPPPPRSQRAHGPANTLMVEHWPLELGVNKALLSLPPRRWQLVLAAWEPHTPTSAEAKDKTEDEGTPSPICFRLAFLCTM